MPARGTKPLPLWWPGKKNHSLMSFLMQDTEARAGAASYRLWLLSSLLTVAMTGSGDQSHFQCVEFILRQPPN